MICTTYFLTFFSELIPPTGLIITLSIAGLEIGYTHKKISYEIQGKYKIRF